MKLEIPPDTTMVSFQNAGDKTAYFSGAPDLDWTYCYSVDPGCSWFLKAGGAPLPEAIYFQMQDGSEPKIVHHISNQIFPSEAEILGSLGLALKDENAY